MNTYFIIEPYVYSCIKNKTILLLNPYNNNYIIKDIELSDGEFLLKSIENEGVLELGTISLSSEIESIIEEASEKNIGSTIYSSNSAPPFNFLPKFSFQGDIEKNILNEKTFEASHIKNNLTEISIYLNNHSSVLPKTHFGLYKQVPISYLRGKKRELDGASIFSLLDEILASSTYKIKFMGGNILKYSNLTNIIEYIKGKEINLEFNVYSGDILEKGVIHESINTLQSSGGLLTIVFLTPEELKVFLRQNKAFLNDFPVIIQALVFNPIDHQNYLSISKEHNIKNISLLPIIDNEKSSLLKDMIVAQDDILMQRFTEKRIHSQRIMNRCFWGKLKVLPSGAVYSTFYRKPLGNILRNSINELAYNELTKINSWRLSRSRVKPCKDCLFQDLCMPISEYELYLDKFNLCSINR